MNNNLFQTATTFFRLFDKFRKRIFLIVPNFHWKNSKKLFFSFWKHSNSYLGIRIMNHFGINLIGQFEFAVHYSNALACILDDSMVVRHSKYGIVLKFLNKNVIQRCFSTVHPPWVSRENWWFQDSKFNPNIVKREWTWRQEIVLYIFPAESQIVQIRE